VEKASKLFDTMMNRLNTS
jgi:hypothetical protein